MTIEQIAQIGNVKLNDENSKIFSALKEEIQNWLNSDEFAQNYGGGGETNLTQLI